MPNHLEDFVAAQMQKHPISGLSLAVVGEGKIAQTLCFGFTDQTGKSPVSASTLFQAASVSKCLAALAALRLVDQGQLSLDADVNSKLQSWKIPANQFLKQEQVTLRRLLCHNAGITVHGFSGYVAGLPIPTLEQIFNGTPPANNPAIRVDAIPGANPRYSGGGYVVLQQLLMDVLDRPFPELMQSLVLHPLGMSSSTFDQPLHPSLLSNAATGHSQSGKPILGGAHLYPEMAAAGLWTTPSDLARFVIGVQQSFTAQSDSILSLKIAREMLTPQAARFGLGPTIVGNGNTLQFLHSGRNAGFDAVLVASVETGKGVVIMINANADPKALNSILKVVINEFH
ncbi:MAG TPA: serine hydrolase domain-containing protein [Verrucomicrobiae bacterium]|jgi:CubicO group peptidase (beta-lactamase class C family)|nr:serine hydrolase domain-containing protein [Verrucomicrobiae bacterium]